jgi:flagellar protein FlbD
MIRLTRLNNHPFIINSDLIKSVENAPDTVLTLVTGDKIVVLESSQEVLDKIIEFRRRILAGLPVPALHLPESGLAASDRGGSNVPSKTDLRG